jgi:2-polyprenyl-3-methyl-5-hydroxy-6-metoxy-1,4-benzoquinol methylase
MKKVLPRSIISFYSLHFMEQVTASNHGERLVAKDWQTAKNATDLVTFAHIQRYEWVLPYLQNLRCLDDGCGTGYGTGHLSNYTAEIMGVDKSTSAIKFANKYFKTEKCCFKQMDSTNLKFEDESFEAVISFDVLEHIPQEKQEKFILEIARVLKNDGAAYVGCPNSELSTGANPFHEKELNKTEFESLLQKAFAEVKLFGQDLVVNGLRQGKDSFNCIAPFEGVIAEDNVESTFGLLAICKKPK